MKAHPLPTALFIACLTVSLFGEEDTSANSTTTEGTRALLREDAKNKAAHAAPQPAPAPVSTKSDKPEPTATPAPAPTPTPTPTPTPGPASTPKADVAIPTKPVAEPATMLPAVEVSRSKINELNRQIHEQDIAIEREKKNTKSTELDKALNDPKVSIPILGGQTTQYKTTVASERVSLMEEERDILEEMKLAKTKEDKAELQKELDEVRILRRDLEKNLR
jgi:outer membrane biosynthesis protein TonB